MSPEGLTLPAARTAYREIVVHDPCAYCGRPAEVVDHIVARVWPGGFDEWENLTGACSACNSAKGWKSLLTVMLGEHVGAYRRNGKPYRPWTEAWWRRPT